MRPKLNYKTIEQFTKPPKYNNQVKNQYNQIKVINEA